MKQTIKITLALLAATITGFVLNGHYYDYECAQHCKDIYENNLQLKKAYDEEREYVIILEAEVERLSDENGIFTSMLGEIESEPGGSEILKKLWDEHHGGH